MSPFGTVVFRSVPRLKQPEKGFFPPGPPASRQVDDRSRRRVHKSRQPFGLIIAQVPFRQCRAPLPPPAAQRSSPQGFRRRRQRGCRQSARPLALRQQLLRSLLHRPVFQRGRGGGPGNARRRARSHLFQGRHQIQPDPIPKIPPVPVAFILPPGNPLRPQGLPQLRAENPQQRPQQDLPVPLFPGAHAAQSLRPGSPQQPHHPGFRLIVQLMSQHQGGNPLFFHDPEKGFVPALPGRIFIRPLQGEPTDPKRQVPRPAQIGHEALIPVGSLPPEPVVHMDGQRISLPPVPQNPHHAQQRHGVRASADCHKASAPGSGIHPVRQLRQRAHGRSGAAHTLHGSSFT